MSTTQVVVGRQPVFDADLGVIGYELLFRQEDRDETSASHLHDGDEMTTAVFHSAVSIGLDRLVGDKTIFCNADRGVLTGAVPIPLPPERTVVEVLESVRFDAEIDAGCRALRAAGYRLALDDFEWFDGAERLVEQAAVVKIDVRQLGPDSSLDLMQRCRPYGVQLLAEKVETPDELAFYRGHGFDLYQGFALARPTALSARILEPSALGVLQIASAVLDERTDFDEVERILRRDPALAVQLLQVASIGPVGGLRRPVRSIREALVLLGTHRVRTWISLLMLRSSNAGSPDDLVTVLARARMCELLACRDNSEQAAFAFTAGMVSALDRLLGPPATQLTTVLPLDGQLLGAAFGTDSSMGRLVHRVIDFESGGPPAGPDEEFAALRDVSASALDWAVRSSVQIDAA